MELGPGVTILSGPNGAGKTTLLEAVAWVALGRSFRGVPDPVLVRTGCDEAIIRAEVDHDGRRQTLDAALRRVGRNRVRCNGHALTGRRDRLDVLRVTVFAPDDLALIKGGPARRRDYLDDLLAALAPRYHAARADYERVLRHRNALLKGGARGPEASVTLDVFDEQLARAGAELVRGRLRLSARLEPRIQQAYEHLAGGRAAICACYEAGWESAPIGEDDIEGRLRAALAANRSREIERRLTLTGPHRDEWRLTIDGLDTRTHASQGEQRCLALALRLAGHAVCEQAMGTPPVLLLDDVFSELDEQRARSLAAALPPGQTLITTAGALPVGVEVEQRLHVDAGELTAVRG